jgi:tetratricopeptide (TPR) repeat protein
MARHSELVIQIQTLLSAEMWKEASVYVRHAAQKVEHRGQSRELRALTEQVPAAVRAQGDWPEALAWVAYRTADLELLIGALKAAPARWPAFEAFRASLEHRWTDTLALAERAYSGPDHKPDTDHRPGPAEAVAARFRACALAELQRPGWQEAYREAAARATGRDRGLLLLEFGHQLSSRQQEEAAREAYAQAVPDLRGDPLWLTLTQANLGITCLRLGLLSDASRALQSAIRTGQQGEGLHHLSTAWRGLGGLALHQGQFARAHHAFAVAYTKADNLSDQVAAYRGTARVYRLQGRFDEAMTQLYEALRYVTAGQQSGDVQPLGQVQPHPVYADLAALHLLIADPEAAQRSLTHAVAATTSDGWRIQVVQAELRRLGSESEPEASLHELRLDQTWAQEEAWVFPALFARLGQRALRPVWSAQISTDGPISLSMNGEQVPLFPQRASASLLAFLTYQGGSVSAERALEALDLPGKTVRARQQALSKVVAELRVLLGWPDSVISRGGLLHLSAEPCWNALELPPASRADLFCEGRLDPWVLLWREEQSPRFE